MNYFKEIPDQHLKEFFLEDLKCINNIITFSYPHSTYENEDIEDEDQFFSQHLDKCKSILKNYIKYKVSEITELENIEIDNIANEKAKEIFRSCDQDIQVTWETLNMKEIHLSKKISYHKISDNLLLVCGEIAGRSVFHRIKTLFSK